MRLGQLSLLVAMGALCACGRSQPQQPAPTAPRAAGAPAAVTPQPTPPPPPPQRPAIDPRSSEAAEDIARGFLDLVNRGHFDEAYMLLGPGAPPRADFDRQFAAYTDLHARMGTPGPQEGAAGSIYLSVPVQLAGKLRGKAVERSFNLVLRRVNDVPGSTEAQRHWHIDRIETPSA